MVVERDDPLLFLADGEFVDVVDQLMGVDPAEVAQALAGGWVGGEGALLLWDRWRPKCEAVM